MAGRRVWDKDVCYVQENVVVPQFKWDLLSTECVPQERAIPWNTALCSPGKSHPLEYCIVWRQVSLSSISHSMLAQRQLSACGWKSEVNQLKRSCKGVWSLGTRRSTWEHILMLNNICLCLYLFHYANDLRTGYTPQHYLFKCSFQISQSVGKLLLVES